MILAERVRAIIGQPVPLNHMFGGLTFMLNGNMLCRVSNKGLMARVGAAAESDALARPFATRCLGAGRPMVGFILVDPRALTSEAELRVWVQMAMAYVGKLPPKEPKARKSKPRAPKPATPQSRRVS